MKGDANKRVILLASLLHDLVAFRYVVARDLLDAAIADHDGHTTSRTFGQPPGSGCSGNSSSTEAAVARRSGLDNERADLVDSLHGLELAVNHIIRTTTGTIARHAPHTSQVEMCADNQLGKPGVNDWGDSHCPMPADKAGLCAACYQRSRRWKAPR